LSALKTDYDEGRDRMGNDYDFYNLVEKCLIDVELKESDKEWV
jgi:hypothetical protein